MANIHWKSAVSADFNTAADWSTGTVPGASDNAILDAKGGAYTVTANTAETVNSIQLASNATLVVNARTFTATNGTGSGGNAGVIDITNNNFMAFGGAFTNTGQVNLQSGGNDTELMINGSATLSGGGRVTLSDNSQNYISASSAGNTLTNVDNTISGAGDIGYGSLVINNQTAGVINASGTNALRIDTGASLVTNAGLMEATGSGGLTIYNDTVANTGTILATAGSAVNLQTADIQGGALSTSGTGVIQVVDRGSLLDGTAAAVSNTGVLDILNNTYLHISGTIKNSAQVNLQSGGNDTELMINGSATLSGGGSVTLSDNSQNYISASAAGNTLTNVDNTISGGGYLGNNYLVINNNAKGVINASGASALVINPGTSVVTNAGLMEGTGAGGLTILSCTVANTGTLLAATGSEVSLQSADIQGGTLATSGTGVVQAIDRGSLLDGTKASVTNNGVVNVTNNNFLYIQGMIANGKGATINLDSIGNTTALIVTAANATLTGGTVNLTDNGNNIIDGTVSGPSGSQVASSLTNKTTIQGSGLVGDGSLSLINSGTIDATGASALEIDVGGGNFAGSSTVTNTGLLEATNPNALATTGGLLLYDDTIGNGTTGVIEANGAATHVDLQSATIAGGTLKTAKGGVFQAVDRGSLLDGTASAVTNAAVIDILNDNYLHISGAIKNSGQINLQSSANDTELVINGSATLSGGGSVTLSDNSQNYISASAAGNTLTNVDNTISGAGDIGYDYLVINNQAAGVINASGTNALRIDTGTSLVTNAGLMEATGSGGLTIYNDTVANTGTILAAAGSAVNLQTADIQGGTLATSGSGVIQAIDRGSLLDGTTNAVDITGVVNVTNNNFLYVEGAIDNTGSINLLSTGNDTRLRLNANTTLTGNGVIFLNGNSNNTFDAVAGGITLTNDGNTLEGSGNLFGGTTPVFINGKGGVVDGNQAAALVLSTPGDTITNMGTLEGTGAGGLTVEGVVNGSGGMVFAGAGSNVTFSGATLTGGGFTTAATGEIVIGDGSTTTIDSVIGNGGTIFVDSTKSVTSLVFDKSTSLTGGGVLELSGEKNNIVEGTKSSIVLTNVDNTIEGGGKLGNKKLTLVNQAGGVIDGDSKAGLMINTGSASITNAGLIEATNKGKLTLASAVMNTGTIEANGGTLTLQAAVTGGGAIDIVSGTLDIANANAAENVAFTGKSGTLELDQSQTYTGQVSGFSTSGKDSLDLRDISFISGTTTASYSGNASSGILTVTDGTHTAQIHLVGNYTGSSFTVASDKHGGTTVTDPMAQAPMHGFIAAAASMGAVSSVSVAPALPTSAAVQPTLATPLHG